MAPDTMRAWLYNTAHGGLEKSLHLETNAPQPPQPLKPNQLLVRVHSMSVNRLDHKLPELGLPARAVIPTPASPGTDFCGAVVAAGSAAAAEFKAGDAVFGKLDRPRRFGSLAELLVVDDWCVARRPAALSADDAATIGVAGLTAYQSLVGIGGSSSGGSGSSDGSAVKAGERVFINGGSGGTGTFGIQLARALGCAVTATCSTGNVALLRELGADEVIDYRKEDVVAALKARGPVFSLVIDNVGTPAALYKESHHFLKPDGRFVQVGAEPSVGSAASLAQRALVPAFLGGGRRKFVFLSNKPVRQDYDQIAAWMVEGKVKAVIEQTYEFGDAPKAYEKLKEGRTRGKIVVHVGKE